MADDWQMPRRGDACSACGRSFEPGETFTACLYEADGGYRRADYCQACPPTEEPGLLARWLTRRPEPTQPRKVTLDRQALLALFEQLQEARSADKLQLRFVLALLLWRKKVIKLERSTTDDDGRELWHFVAPKLSATYAVVRPDLGEQQLEDLSQQLETLVTPAATADQAEPASDAPAPAPDHA